MTLIVTAMLVIAVFFVNWKLHKIYVHLDYFSAPLRSRVTFAVFLTFFALPVYGLFTHWFGSGFTIDETPRWLQYWFWFGLILLIQATAWFLFIDLLKLGLNKGLSVNAPELDKFLGFIYIGTFAFLALVTSIKLGRDTNRMVTKKYELPIENVDKHFDFTIAHISDIQADVFTNSAKLKQFVEKVNAENPDIVIFTGDLITSGTKYIPEGAAALASISAPFGIYAVIGDHDFWAGKQLVASELAKKGITLLEDAHTTVGINGINIQIIGATDIYNRPLSVDMLRKLLSGREEADISIYAAHQIKEPQVEILRQENIPLALAGHTHGGQIRIPVFFKKLSADMLETKYRTGLYRASGTTVHIDSGLGYTLAPIRYNAPATISILRLKSR